ncbi:MAG TPA: nuclear transport factor 2 family protein [Rhizobiaceae bacterium]|nr:nuclear transport factor 2 family protein [Rhizobiaceae bacterium]
MQKPVRVSLEDRAEIEDLYNEYLWALDTGDSEAYANCFAPDAILREDHPDGTTRDIKGRADIHAFVLRYHQNPDFAGHQHRESTRLFFADPDGRRDHYAVRSTTWALKYDSSSGAAHLHYAGYYRDVVGRIDGEWKLVTRWIAPWKGEILSRFDGA